MACLLIEETGGNAFTYLSRSACAELQEEANRALKLLRTDVSCQMQREERELAGGRLHTSPCQARHVAWSHLPSFSPIHPLSPAHLDLSSRTFLLLCFAQVRSASTVLFLTPFPFLGTFDYYLRLPLRSKSEQATDAVSVATAQVCILLKSDGLVSTEVFVKKRIRGQSVSVLLVSLFLPSPMFLVDLLYLISWFPSFSISFLLFRRKNASAAIFPSPLTCPEKPHRSSASPWGTVRAACVPCPLLAVLSRTWEERGSGDGYGWASQSTLCRRCDLWIGDHRLRRRQRRER